MYRWLAKDDVVANLKRRMADVMVQMNVVQAREAAVIAELRALQAAPVPAGCWVLKTGRLDRASNR